MTTSAVSKPRTCLYFFPLESIGLHGVPGLEFLPTFEPDTALLPGRHLAHVLFEVLEGADSTLEDLLSGPEQLDPASTADLALHHAASGDDTEARDLDRGDDLDPALADLAVGGFAQALGRTLHILCQLVDHVVVADLDLRPLGRGRAGRSRLQVEADDDRARDARQQQVGGAHGSHALAHDLDRDHGVLDLLERGEQGFERALGVRLDDQAQLFDLALLRPARQVFQGDARGNVARGFLGPLLDQLGEGDLARRLFRADHLEDVPRLRHLAHAGNDHRGRRRSIRDAAAAVVSQRTDAAVDVATDKVVADLQRPGLHQNRRHGPATALEVGVNDGADRVAVRVGLELEDIGGEHDGREQVVDARARLGAQVDALVLPAVVACHDSLLGQLLMHPIHVGVVFIDLVDGDDDRHLGGPRVMDRLDRLWHHAVVGRYNQDDEVGDLRAPGAHGGEGFVAGILEAMSFLITSTGLTPSLSARSLTDSVGGSTARRSPLVSILVATAGLKAVRAASIAPGARGAAAFRVSLRCWRKLTSSFWLMPSSRASSCAFMPELLIMPPGPNSKPGGASALGGPWVSPPAVRATSPQGGEGDLIYRISSQSSGWTGVFRARSTDRRLRANSMHSAVAWR